MGKKNPAQTKHYNVQSQLAPSDQLLNSWSSKSYINYNLCSKCFLTASTALRIVPRHFRSCTSVLASWLSLTEFKPFENDKNFAAESIKICCLVSEMVIKMSQKICGSLYGKRVIIYAEKAAMQLDMN